MRRIDYFYKGKRFQRVTRWSKGKRVEDYWAFEESRYDRAWQVREAIDNQGNYLTVESRATLEAVALAVA